MCTLLLLTEERYGARCPYRVLVLYHSHNQLHLLLLRAGLSQRNLLTSFMRQTKRLAGRACVYKFVLKLGHCKYVCNPFVPHLSLLTKAEGSRFGASATAAGEAGPGSCSLHLSHAAPVPARGRCSDFLGSCCVEARAQHAAAGEVWGEGSDF